MDTNKGRKPKRLKSILVIALLVVLVGSVMKYYEGKDEANIAFQEYLRSNEPVMAQTGNISSITVLKRLTYYKSDTGPGYHQYLYLVKGQRGNMTVEIKRLEGSTQIEISDIQQ